MRTAILPILLVLLSLTASAQPPCGFDVVHNRLRNSDPVFQQKIDQNEASIADYINKHPELLNRHSRIEASYTIPVVVHVMHTGGAVGTIYNPSDAQILGAIQYLNDVFAGTYPGMVAPVEGGPIVDLEIRFELAQRTPSCGFTNGIDRVNASSIPNYVANGVNASGSSGSPELEVKDLARWNPADYYNIWVVNKIDGADGTSGQFTAGFAYFPGASANLDGTIMLATQMITGQKTLPHEVGHALNLYHTFQGSANNTQCPANTTCATQGDRVCDTDPVFNNVSSVTGVYNFSCRAGANPCASSIPYTRNTEQNFMAYTNCYNLFTNGQKARVQAAMSLPSRTSLVAVGNQALVPCTGPYINFSTANFTKTESNTTTAGCRKYTDYTYEMTIGAAPTQSATVTLSFTGTGIKGLDYEVTTNGNFSSPSNILTFPAGSTTAQPINIRVYDDAAVEAGETAILDFTVNAGTGNALKGVTFPTLSISLTDNDVVPNGSGSGTFLIGGLNTLVSNAPFDARLQNQKSQYIYKASELIAAGLSAGQINEFSLYVYAKYTTRAFTNFTIRMANTPVTYLVDGSFTPIGGMTTVFNTASYSTIEEWNTFVLSTPFNWDGTSSLAIEICFENAAADAGNDTDDLGAYSDGGSGTQGNMVYQAINCAGSFSTVGYYNTGIKPLISLDISMPGTPVETVVSSTASTHLATGSNDYIYSNNGRLMMRIGSISASLGCVTGTVEEAGTTWVNAFGGQRSAKVFLVNPTTNGATTTYNASFYFTMAELAGKSAGQMRVAKTTAASAAAANTSNTVFMTPGVSFLGGNTVVFTANFTGFSRFFLVDGGVTLPVSLLDLAATPNNDNNTLVTWSTASETDNKQFDVQYSGDGINFSLLGTVLSLGNSSTVQEYELMHLNPAEGTTWYRLKQIDLDGNIQYSRIVSAHIANKSLKTLLFPVPAKDVITIRFASPVNNCGVEILSADMRVLSRQMLNGSTSQKDLDINRLPSGVYFIRLTSSTVNETLRFVK
jgi:hypothetical protein